MRAPTEYRGMRKILFALLLLVYSMLLSRVDARRVEQAAYWIGTLSEAGADLPVTISFEPTKNGGWTGRFTSSTQGVMEYPFDSVSVHDSSLSVVLGGGDISFHGTLSGDHLTGAFDGDEGKGTFALQRAVKPSYPYRSDAITFRNGNTLLAGSVYAARTSGRHRAVVLLHGSGPESRWGTIRYIADQLARNGVTTLIYDKRGSGDSGGDWRTASYADLADDAIAGIKLLQARSDVDGRRIGIWGHSQGGYIAPLVASRCHDVAFIVAADSPAMAQYQQDLYHVRNSARDHGWTGKTGAAAMALYKQFIEVALTGKGFGELTQAMERNKKEPWLAWRGIPPKNSWLWPWYRKTGYYDSRPYWRNVKVPILLVYGELDELQPVDTSIATIQRLARANGNQDVEAFILPAAPHVLHIAPKPGERFFWWHFVPGYPSIVIDWIKAHGKN